MYVSVISGSNVHMAGRQTDRQADTRTKSRTQITTVQRKTYKRFWGFNIYLFIYLFITDIVITEQVL